MNKFWKKKPRKKRIIFRTFPFIYWISRVSFWNFIGLIIKTDNSKISSFICFTKANSRQVFVILGPLCIFVWYKIWSALTHTHIHTDSHTHFASNETGCNVYIIRLRLIECQPKINIYIRSKIVSAKRDTSLRWNYWQSSLTNKFSEKLIRT